jgi:glycosyltransferase involved in cell wall biosynthesis
MVVFDLSAAAHERAGLGRYASQLAEALLAIGVPLTAFVNDPRDGQLKPPLNALPRLSAHRRRKRWRLEAALGYFGGPTLKRVFPGVTAFHATEHLLPVIPGAKNVFTLHDAAYLRYPQYHLWQNRVYLQTMMPRFLRRADHVICVSDFTRCDAEQFYGLPPEKMTVIHEGVEPRFQPNQDPAAHAALRARYRLPDRFILYVGTLEPRKNLATLVDAFRHVRVEHPDVGLVIAGGKGWLYEPFLNHLAASGVAEQVALTGYVPDADLPTLLSMATVFAFPSVFEGFGLPVLEAMACGTPAVVADAASLPEIAGDAGLLIAPLDIDGWAQALCRVLADPALARDLQARGLARARRFTWENTAWKTADVYRTVFGSAG